MNKGILSDKHQDALEPPKKKSKVSHIVAQVIGIDGYAPTASSSCFCLSDLPDEVLLSIFQYLDDKTVSTLSLVCKSFHKAAKDTLLCRNIILKYNMDQSVLDSYVANVSCPKQLTLEYKYFSKKHPVEDYTRFNESVALLIEKFGKHLITVHFKHCRNNEILSLLSKCPNLQSISLFHCKGSFETLPLLTKLRRIECRGSDIPGTILQETLRNNPHLKSILLADNTNLHVNTIADTIGQYNKDIEEIKFSEKRKIRAKGVRALARCSKLRTLDLTGGPFQCDPEDSLQQLAAGCPRLEKLSIWNWKGINDDNLLPILQCCTQLKELNFIGVDITVKSCREAALSLPFLHKLCVDKCALIKKSELIRFQTDFQEIDFPVY